MGGKTDQELHTIERRHLQGQGLSPTWKEVCVIVPWSGLCCWIQGLSNALLHFRGQRKFRTLISPSSLATGPPKNIQVRRSTHCARLPDEALRVQL